MTKIERKEIADQIINVFCVGICWVYMSLMSFPIFVPLIAYKFELSGAVIGAVLALPALIAIISMSILNRHITVIGIEEAIFYSGIFFSLSMCLMGGA